MDDLERFEYFAQSELNSISKYKKHVVAKFVEDQENEDMRPDLDRLATGCGLDFD